MFSAHPASRRRSHFLPKPLRKHASHHISIFVVKNHETFSKLSQKRLPRRSQNRLKIIKNQVWSQRCPKKCPQGRLGHQNGSPGIQNRPSRVLKWSPEGLKITFSERKFHANSCLFYRSAVGQLLVHRGAGGRGEALRYYTILYYNIINDIILRYRTVQYSTVQNSTAHYNII